jgi:hypothetical protein
VLRVSASLSTISNTRHGQTLITATLGAAFHGATALHGINRWAETVLPSRSDAEGECLTVHDIKHTTWTNPTHCHTRRGLSRGHGVTRHQPMGGNGVAPHALTLRWHRGHARNPHNRSLRSTVNGATQPPQGRDL